MHVSENIHRRIVPPMQQSISFHRLYPVGIAADNGALD
jgi:hypothetical protein